MTKVIFYQKNKNWIGYQLEGHSGFGVEGEDIVCAAISVLTWQVYNSILRLTKDRPILIEDEEEVFIQCNFEFVSEQSRLLLESYYLSISHLSEVYPEYISLKVEEVE